MSTLTLTSITISDMPIPGADPWYANPDDPAITVMTDFRERASVTILETQTIDVALEHMKHAGVRCAFATNNNQRVVGIITAYDILGEKPMQHVQTVASSRQDVLVQDIMTKTAAWQILNVKELELHCVGALHQLLVNARLTHIPVMEFDDHGAARLRGLLSAAKIRRLLSK